jgi:hypothetical protein
MSESQISVDRSGENHPKGKGKLYPFLLIAIKKKKEN